MAAIPAAGGGAQEARFADGSAGLSVDAASGAVLLGGRVLGAEPVFIPDLPLDASRPSDENVRAPNPLPKPDPEPLPEPEPFPWPEPDPFPWPEPKPDPKPEPRPEQLSVQKGSNITQPLAYGAIFDASGDAFGIDLSGLAASDSDQTITIKGLGVDDTLIFSQKLLNFGLAVDRSVNNAGTGAGAAFTPDGAIDIRVGTGGKGELTIHLVDVDPDIERLADLGNYTGLNRGFHASNDLDGGANVDHALTVQYQSSNGPRNYGSTGFPGITWDSDPAPDPEPSREETITDYPEGADSVSGSSGRNTFFDFPDAGALAGMAVIDPDGPQGMVQLGMRSPHDNLLFAWTEDGGLPARIVGVENIEAVWKGSGQEGRFDASGIVFENSGAAILSAARPDTVIVLANAVSQEYMAGENVSRLIVENPDHDVILYAAGRTIHVRDSISPTQVHGSAGRDRAFVEDSCRDVTVAGTVEEIHFSGKAASYGFIQHTDGMGVIRQGDLLASIAVNDGNQILCFADGTATFMQDPDTGAFVESVT